MKILHVISQRPDSTGSGVYVQAIIREAHLSGHKNYLIAATESENIPDLDCISKESCSYVRFEGADISYPIVGMSDVMPYPSRRFSDMTGDDLLHYETAFKRKLVEALSNLRPDIIHSHHLWILSSLVRQMVANLPVVTTSHGSDLRQFQKCHHLRQQVLSGCARLDAVMALSDAQKREIAHLYRIPAERIHVTGAGFDDSLFLPSEKPTPDPVQIVYAGKLSRAKGVPWMLRALQQIQSPLWQLHLVGRGTGDEEKECLRLADEMGRRVHIYGAIDHREVARIMRQCHVFILPSFYEGLGLVVLEALACGCRIVATNLSGVSELLGRIQGDYISLVNPPRLHSVDVPCAEDEQTFEINLERALRDQLRLAKAEPHIDLSPVREYISSFTWSSVFKRVDEIYLRSLRAYTSHRTG